MSVHIRQLTRTPLFIYVYSGVPPSAPAAFHRLDYDATCVATWDPKKSAAFLFGLHGRISRADGREIAEQLHAQYGVIVVGWTRADGRRVRLRRESSGRWRIMHDGSEAPGRTAPKVSGPTGAGPQKPEVGGSPGAAST